MNRNTQALTEATRRRHETAEKAVQRALREVRKSRTPITVNGIAAAAGVSTDFIYRHRELRPEVEALRRARSSPSAPAVGDHPDTDAAESTLVRRLSQQLSDVRRKHHEELAELRCALEAAHGELLVLRRQLSERPGLPHS